MISLLEGTILEKTENRAVIFTSAGIGFEVNITFNTAANIGHIGDVARIYTYLQVKEDDMLLFGFLTKDELDTFKLLITVNGIGPKGAISILSSISVEDLTYAIIAEDSKSISKVPGIGPKTAAKLVLELKDKFRKKSEEIIDSVLDSAETSTADNISSKSKAVKDEAVMALTSLGYSLTEATKALAGCKVDDNSTVEDLIKQCLRNF